MVNGGVILAPRLLYVLRTRLIGSGMHETSLAAASSLRQVPVRVPA